MFNIGKEVNSGLFFNWDDLMLVYVGKLELNVIKCLTFDLPILTGIN